MRAVLDTNVLASALIRRQGVSGQVLRHLRDGIFKIVYSVPLMVELVVVAEESASQLQYLRST